MNIDMIRGDTLKIQFELESDTVLDLESEDFEITFSLKRSSTDAAYVFQKDKTSTQKRSNQKSTTSLSFQKAL